MRPIQHIQKLQSEYALIEHLAEISNLMLADKSKRIKSIELKCFCVLVMAHNRFGDITSKRARDWTLAELARQKGRFTANSLVRYRNRLWQKGWFVKEDFVYRVAPVFDFKILPAQQDRAFVFVTRYIPEA